MNYLIFLQQPIELFGIEVINSQALIELLVRFIFNFIVIFIIVRGIYLASPRQKDYYFAYILISSVIFLLCFLLGNVKLQYGFALGLFAIFGIMRYRTQLMPIKEMTYLFLIIAISVINALASKKVSYAELLSTNAILVFVIWMGEYFWRSKHEGKKMIVFENVELITPDKKEALLTELKNRTGLDITRVEIGDINYLRDSVKLMIYFRNDDNDHFIENYDDGSD
jgi:Domain of unknown function (DUF4956)